MAKKPVPERDKAAQSKTKPEFEDLLGEFLKTYVPEVKGKRKSPETEHIELKFDSIHGAVLKKVTYEMIADLLRRSSGMEITAGQLANVYRAMAVAKGLADPPKPRKKADKPEAEQEK
jgi:hypothetical protein